MDEEDKNEDEEEVDKASQLSALLNAVTLLYKLRDLIASLVHSYIAFCLCKPCVFLIYNLILHFWKVT